MLEDLQRGRGARGRLLGEGFRNMDDDGGRHLTAGNQRDAHLQRRNRRYHHQMCDLAETAGCLVLAVRVRVGEDLEQEQKRQHTKSDCQWFGKSAQEWMRYSEHFCASYQESRSGSSPPTAVRRNRAVKSLNQRMLAFASEIRAWFAVGRRALL